VRITSGNLGGDVPLERVATGIYLGRVVIPRRGDWEVQVSLRLGKFENPVAGVAFDVR
jgi:copper transport protein